ncbi:hypothetical protein TNCV_4333081 [Trichonephila clavipes]|nr:hypothetical protein TNCV_4333081 [Trichonephila clavipes]
MVIVMCLEPGMFHRVAGFLHDATEEPPFYNEDGRKIDQSSESSSWRVMPKEMPSLLLGLGLKSRRL